MTNGKNRVRLAVERLEDRCTPSALLGDPSAPAPSPPGKPSAPAAALAAGPRQHAVPIHLSTHVASDGSLALSLTGIGGQLGRLAGQGVVENRVVDEGAGQLAASGTATFIAANGDQLFVCFTVSLDLKTLQGEETLTFTGGTGRFDGAAGGAVSLHCDTTWDPASPLTFACDSEGFGTLTLDHSR